MEKKRANMKDTAYFRIRQMIISGQLVPGQKVTETQLAEMLSMGRTPVREAVLSLEQDFLVRIHPRKFIEIAPVSLTLINDIFELRIYLEPAVLRKHASSIDMIRLIALKQRITENISIYECALSSRCADISRAGEQDPQYPCDVVNVDEEFHSLVIDCGDNKMISDLSSKYMDYTCVLFSLNSRMESSRSYESDKEHLRIIDAIIKNDVDLAAKLLEEHLVLSRSEIIRVLIQRDCISDIPKKSL